MRAWRVLWHPFFFLPERWNGMDEHLLLLSRHLDRHRFDLWLMTHATDGPQSATLAARAGLRLVPAPYSPETPLPARVVALRALYRREGVDLLHLHSPVVGGQLAPALAARLAGVRAVLATYHQVQPYRLPARSRAINAFTHRLLLDRTIAVSAGVRRTMGAHTGVSPGRVEVVHNGIDPDPEVREGSPPGLPPRKPGEVRLGCFARLSPEKGQSIVLEAMAQLVRRCPTAHLLIAGDGPQRAELEATATRLGLAGRVTFLGFRDDFRAIMGTVDVVVHAPVYEGFGIVVLEAMAAGRPVVVNDAPGGVTEIVVPEVTGLVAPAGSATALAATLERLVTDPSLRDRLGRQGHTHFHGRFTAQQMAASVSNLYEAALGRRRPPATAWLPGRSLAAPGAAPATGDR